MGHLRGSIAVVINIVVCIALLVALGLLFHKTHSHDGTVSVHLTGVDALIWFAAVLVYLIVPKLLTGQTVGRMLVGGHNRR